MKPSDFRTILLSERKRIVSGGRGELEVLTTSESLGVDDQAQLLYDQFVAVLQRGMSHRKLKLIDAALARVDCGDFGVCEECGEGIPLKRLKSVPWAAYCIVCQDRLDAEASTGEAEILSTV